MNRIEKNEDGSFTVYYKSGEEESSIKTGMVMFGTGRKPNTRGIGLEVQTLLVLEVTEELAAFTELCGLHLHKTG